MLHGYAWSVEYPRRAHQNFVTTDTKYLAEELMKDMRNLPDWRFRVSMVPYRGETALSVTTTIGDLLDLLSERGAAYPLSHKDGILSYDPK